LNFLKKIEQQGKKRAVFHHVISKEIIIMDIKQMLITIPGVIIGFTIHEYSHALAAYKLGDLTAKEDGRLTLDPFKHIDIIGLIFIIFAGFGWAKPVKFYPDLLRNPRRDKAIIAAAGPFANLLLGVLFFLIIICLMSFNINNERVIIMNYIINVLRSWASINIGLFIFNMLPIPPLDGSHILLSALNVRYEAEQRIMNIGSLFFIIIIIIEKMI
jgi:Zn-dependent protease